jgi:hypothetical protein
MDGLNNRNIKFPYISSLQIVCYLISILILIIKIYRNIDSQYYKANHELKSSWNLRLTRCQEPHLALLGHAARQSSLFKLVDKIYQI